MIGLQGLRGSYDEVFLPLYGAHQAQNAALALAAVEAFVGGDDAAGRRAWSGRRSPRSTSPGRLEIIRRSPTIVLDAAHNPHGAAALVDALEDSFTFSPLIGVVGVMADKDYEGLLSDARAGVRAHRLHPELHGARAAGRTSWPRSPAGSSARTGSARPPRWSTRSTRPTTLAEAGGVFGEAIGSGGVLVTGSVITVGEARATAAPAARREHGVMQRRLCAAILLLEAIALGLSTPVLISVRGPSTPRARCGSGSASPSPACWSPGCCASPWAYWLGWAIQVAAIALGFQVDGDVRARARSSWRSGPRPSGWAGSIDRDRAAVAGTVTGTQGFGHEPADHPAHSRPRSSPTPSAAGWSARSWRGSRPRG